MAFDGAGNGINRPETWMGIEEIQRSNGTPRTPWDAAHGVGGAINRSP
ncbi:MAG: hypothetical protein ACJAZW_001348 [Maritalea sp.]|jgi:hypothetical protein